jgi:hypothetical protein
MKPQYAMLSCDNNQDYLDYWPLVAHAWKHHMGVEPVLCYIGTEPIKDLQKHGTVISFAPLSDIPLPFQAQWARFWATIKFQNSVCVISDIDMIPLSRKYFVETLEGIDEDQYVHLNPCVDHYSHGHLPACYHVAKGALFTQIHTLTDDWRGSCEMVLKFNDQTPSTFNRCGRPAYWFADELYSSHKISQHTQQSIFTFLPRDTAYRGRRIDRSNWTYQLKDLKNNCYYDAHCPRPYRTNKAIVDAVMNRTALPLTYRIKHFSTRTLKASKRILTKNLL